MAKTPKYPNPAFFRTKNNMDWKMCIRDSISGRRWGDAENYELTVDSSAGLEETAAIIVAYARAAAGEK